MVNASNAAHRKAMSSSSCNEASSSTSKSAVDGILLLDQNACQSQSMQVIKFLITLLLVLDVRNKSLHDQGGRSDLHNFQSLSLEINSERRSCHAALNVAWI